MTKEEFISLYNRPFDLKHIDYIKEMAEHFFAPENRVHQSWLIDGFDVVNGEMVRKMPQNA